MSSIFASLPIGFGPGAIATAVGGLILVAGAADDFYERKFRNSLFIGSSLFAFAAVGFSSGWIGLQQATLGFLAGFALSMPLVVIGAIGAGDMKLLAAFGAACGWIAAAQTGLYGLIWAAVFGVIQALLRGEGRSLFASTASVVAGRPNSASALHRIPFAAALLIGWMTYLAAGGLV